MKTHSAVLMLTIVTLTWIIAAPALAGPVLVVNDSSNGSAGCIATNLTNLGYTVTQETAAATDPASWLAYDFIVWSSGDNPASIDQEAWITNLENQVAAGRSLWIEGGEVAFNHELNPPFAANVLYMDGYHYLEPAGDISFFEGGHPVVTIPNYLTSPITHTYTTYGDQDSEYVATGGQIVASWTLENTGGASIIAHDSDSDPINGGQIVFTSFRFSAVATASQAPLAENIAAYLTGGAPTPLPTDTPNYPTPTPRPTYCSTPNLPIPDYTPPPIPLQDSIFIPDHGTIADLDVSVLIDHTWTGDIIFILKHMDTGTEVTLIDRPGDPASINGCREDNIDATLDDEAVDPVEDECSNVNPAAIYGTFYPNNPLSAFDGEDLYGTWTVLVTDNYFGDSGSLLEWCMMPALAGAETPTPTLSIIPASSSYSLGVMILILTILLMLPKFRRI